MSLFLFEHNFVLGINRCNHEFLLNHLGSPFGRSYSADFIVGTIYLVCGLFERILCVYFEPSTLVIFTRHTTHEKCSLRSHPIHSPGWKKNLFILLTFICLPAYGLYLGELFLRSTLALGRSRTTIYQFV